MEKIEDFTKEERQVLVDNYKITAKFLIRLNKNRMLYLLTGVSFGIVLGWALTELSYRI